jgi:hypothetical protein
MPLSAVIPLVIVLLILAGTFLAAVFAPKLPLAARVTFAVLLAPVILFCAYGFLCTFEPMDTSVQITWRIIYVAIGLSSLAAILRLALAGTRSAA